MFTIKVADNFHYMDDGETYTLGTFPSLEQAVQRSKEIVDTFLEKNYRPGMTCNDLFDQYKSFGDDPYILGKGKISFSAWDYAEKRCKEICV